MKQEMRKTILHIQPFGEWQQDSSAVAEEAASGTSCVASLARLADGTNSVCGESAWGGRVCARGSLGFKGFFVGF